MNLSGSCGLRALIVSLTAAALLGVSAPATPSSASIQPRVYIVSPADGETVTSPLRVVFGLRGMGIAPAGVQRENTGHHHLLIDTALTNLEAPIPADPQHLHFGGGQTEVLLDLPPGEHTLQLVLGDYLHMPHDPVVMSKVIHITVR